MSNILVTGGAGFIGANFIYYELEHHARDTIICLDALTYAGNLSSLSEPLRSGKLRFIRGNICDRGLVRQVFEDFRPDIVVNFAAESHVDRSIDAPEVFLTTNILGTQVLLDACREHGTGRFHYISTDEVYGDLPLDRPEMQFSESTPLNPSSPYSVSKASADMLVQAYMRTYDIDASITRCSNNYGPYQFPEKLIPRMISLAMDDEPLPVYGDGANVRDWLHVRDHCAAIDIVMRKGARGSIYNVGAGNERSNLDIVQLILEHMGKSRDLIAFVPDRPGHDRRYSINAAKLAAELGWRAQTPFERGMHEVIEWYIAHAGWWRSIISGEYALENARILRQMLAL